MSNNYSDFLIGITSGLVTTLLLWLFLTFYNKIILPSIKELLYKGVDLDGEWHGDLFADEEIEKDGKKEIIKEKFREITLTINQSAYQVKGDLLIKNIINKTETFSFYKYTGFIRDNYVIINYLPKSRKRIGLGSLMFEVKEGGGSLIGHLICTEINGMTIISHDSIKLKRK